MRILMTALGLALALLAAPASARTFEGCSKEQTKLADMAIGNSLELAIRAAAAVADTEQYRDWFGPWSARRGETVRENLKSIVVELQADEVKAVCLPGSEIDCKEGTYAYIMHDRPRVIHLCPSFFAMPTILDARDGIGDQENGTREGTIIHETSHFAYTAHTGDECYSRTDCRNMARDAIRAVTNADSYQYYAEDVLLLVWATPG